MKFSKHISHVFDFILFLRKEKESNTVRARSIVLRHVRFFIYFLAVILPVLGV